mmetsp:Transcript_52167/g.138523  ORF Transcript_52167/g.138523 Transcript_52167/m.138523 type:complete len:487 (+) Transcript_52167:1563-3023(+)
MLGHLVHRERLDARVARLGRRRRRRHGRSGRVRSAERFLLKPAAKVARARERRVLEAQGRLARRRVEAAVHLDAEVRVVHHAHHVPGERFRLAVHRGVPAAAEQLGVLAHHQLAHVHLQLPKAPAPVLAILGRLLGVGQLGERPILAAVHRQLDADHLAAAARVAVALDRVLLAVALERKQLLVGGVRDRRVDVELVDDVVGLVPPALSVGDLGGDVLGQHAVVIEVEEIVTLRLGHANLCQPLDHAAADVPRDDQSQRVAVVGRQPLAVLLIGEHDVARRVHGGEPVDRRAVPPLGHRLGADEAHVVRAVVRRFDAALEQHIAEQHSLPHGACVAGGAPVEADGLLAQVLLLTPVARAHQRHRDLARRHLHQVVHREDFGRVDEAVDRQPEAIPFQLGHGAVVAHIVERGGRDETLLHERWERRLHIEWMAASQADQVGVARNPIVWCPHVARIDVFLVERILVLVEDSVVSRLHPIDAYATHLG